jgi:hypothetical protein
MHDELERALLESSLKEGQPHSFISLFAYLRLNFINLRMREHMISPTMQTIFYTTLYCIHYVNS